MSKFNAILISFCIVANGAVLAAAEPSTGDKQVDRNIRDANEAHQREKQQKEREQAKQNDRDGRTGVTGNKDGIRK